jgi:hypothetical protein
MYCIYCTADIAIACCSSPRYFPHLDNGFSVLHDTVVHCHPHGQTFTEPVYVAFDLPPQLASAAELRRLSIYYSNTNVGETPLWTRFRCETNNEHTSSVSIARFIDDSSNDAISNSAMIFKDKAELVLALHHFCLFVVVVDGRQELAKKASVEGFVKVCAGSRSFAVDASILVGCNEEEVVGVLY